ncbi:MAG: ABC transporter ATP-binding protein [Nitrososphaerota archaeon]
MPLLEVSSLCVWYSIRGRAVQALEGVTFSLDRGRSIAVVGESGCGKSTLAYAVLKLLPANAKVEGAILYDGVDILRVPEEEFRLKYRWTKVALIPQSAFNALTPVLKVKSQIEESIIAHGCRDPREARAKASALLNMVGIEASRHNAYPHQFSGGMRQRALIAAALACDPELLIADEPTTALDVIVQSQILCLLRDLQRRFSLSLIFITHDLSIVAEMCDDILIIYGGMVVEYASARDFLKSPRHPYSKVLLHSIPSIRGPKKVTPTYEAFSPVMPVHGCRFSPRCPKVHEICKRVIPPLQRVSGKTMVACHFPN